MLFIHKTINFLIFFVSKQKKRMGFPVKPLTFWFFRLIFFKGMLYWKKECGIKV